MTGPIEKNIIARKVNKTLGEKAQWASESKWSRGIEEGEERHTRFVGVIVCKILLWHLREGR